MPYTDKNGKVWPDVMPSNGVNLILDPFASADKGRPQYRNDPKAQKEYAYKYGFADKPKEPTGPMEGLALVGGAAGASVIGQQIGQKLGGSLGEKAAETGLSEVSKQVLANQGASVAQGAAPATESLAGLQELPAQFAFDAGAPAAEAAGSTAAATPAAEAAAAEAGMFDLAGVGGAGNLLLPAAGAFGAYNLYDTNRGATNRPAGIAQGAASGAAMGSYFGPWGTGIGAVLGGIYGGTQHESTKDKQKRRWAGLSEAGQGLYAANHPEGDDGIWDTGKYAGQAWTFDKAADLAKDDPTHFQGVYGNEAALGEGYLTAGDAIQKEFVRQNLAAGNYASDGGDVIVKDKDLAQKIFQALKQPVAAQPAAQLANVGIQRPISNNQQWS